MSVRGYPTLRRLCSSSSSTHSVGTLAARATVIRSRSSASSPWAIAVATRINAMVCGSSILIPHPPSPIISFLQPPIYPQLADFVAPRIDVVPHHQRLRLRLHPQLGQHCRHRQRRRRAVAVLDLEGDAESLRHEQRAVHSLGPDLCEHAGGMRAHQLGAGTAFPGNQVGVAEHGLANAERFGTREWYRGTRNIRWKLPASVPLSASR